MKSLRPSAREKKRYLLLRGKNLKNNVEKSILDFIGVLGMSKTGLRWIKFDGKKDSGILSINRESLDSVRASFAVWPSEIRIVKVSGTLKGLK